MCSDSRNDMDGHRCRVFAVQHHPVHMYSFVTGGWDDTVQVGKWLAVRLVMRLVM